jgi:hypothetical protein
MVLVRVLDGVQVDDRGPEASVAPTPISASSGCAEIARTDTASVATRLRRCSRSAVAAVVSRSGSAGFGRNSDAPAPHGDDSVVERRVPTQHDDRQHRVPLTDGGG